jgi:bifunctional non-homologous end joining protein LigD
MPPQENSGFKHDGYRLIARRLNGIVRLYTKNGYDWAERYPLIVEALCGLKVSSIVLDGEAMGAGPDGKDTFDAIWNRTNDEHVRLSAFDLLELDGTDYRERPLSEPKTRLANS